jgi:hypothetical protein
MSGDGSPLPLVWNKSNCMKFQCTLVEQPRGCWSARHSSASLGTVEVIAASRVEVLEKLRNELRYRLELCPCTGEAYQNLQIELQTEV